MGVTEKQLAKRTAHIGSSDMCAILGLGGSKYDIWLAKTGRIEAVEATDPMIAGTFLEAGILDFVEHKLGPIRRNQYRSAPAWRLGANIDAILRDGGIPVEAKCRGHWTRDQWGAPGSDDVPDDVAAQAHVHMICTGKPLCHVAACFEGAKLAMYHVERSERLAKLICESAAEFWFEHVETDTPPEDSEPSMDALKRRIRGNATGIAIDDKLVLDWQAASERRKSAAKHEDEAKRAVLEALGDNELAVCDSGEVRYLEQRGAPILDREAMRRDGLWGKYARETKHRTLRFAARRAD